MYLDCTPHIRLEILLFQFVGRPPTLPYFVVAKSPYAVHTSLFPHLVAIYHPYKMDNRNDNAALKCCNAANRRESIRREIRRGQFDGRHPLPRPSHPRWIAKIPSVPRRRRHQRWYDDSKPHRYTTHIHSEWS
jgi:hypothetical protein